MPQHRSGQESRQQLGQRVGQANQRFQQEVGTIVDSSVQATWQKCIDICNKCMQACEECLTSCLKEADVQARVHCINLLRDCADICEMSAVWMSRGSTYAKQLCSLCADICDACAAECEKFQDKHCQDCAQSCRECASECRQMAS